MDAQKYMAQRIEFFPGEFSLWALVPTITVGRAWSPLNRGGESFLYWCNGIPAVQNSPGCNEKPPAFLAGRTCSERRDLCRYEKLLVCFK